MSTAAGTCILPNWTKSPSGKRLATQELPGAVRTNRALVDPPEIVYSLSFEFFTLASFQTWFGNFETVGYHTPWNFTPPDSSVAAQYVYDLNSVTWNAVTATYFTISCRVRRFYGG